MRILLLLITVLLFAGLKSTAQDNEDKLSLDDVIYIAKQQSPEALIAKHRFRSSYWNFRRYKANYLPSLLLSGNPKFENYIRKTSSSSGDSYDEYRSSDVDLDLSIRQNIIGTGGTFSLNSGLNRNDNFINNDVQYTSNIIYLNYTQPIFQHNPFKWEKRIEPVKYNKAKRKYLEDMENVSITAVNYFFNLLLTQIDRQIAFKNLHNYDTLYKIAIGRYNLGKIAESELLQLELNYLKAQAAVDNTELDLENNLFKLKSFLRIKDDVKIELIPPKKTYHFNIESAKAIDEAKSNTSTALDFEERRLEAESALNEAVMKNRFDADLNASFGLNQNASTLPDAYTNPQNSQIVGLSFIIPILDWGLGKSDVKMAESNQELVMTSIEQERIDFEQNIFLTVMQFNMQKNKLYIAAKSDTVAQKRYDVTQKRYLIGKVNDILDLNNAQIDNDNSKKDYYRSLRNYWQNYFELRKFTLYDFQNNMKINFDIEEIGYID